MPRKIAAPKETKASKKDASKPIKKEPKSKGKKTEVDKDVADSKQSVHYILILDDSYSMQGKQWKDLQSATDEFLKTLVNSKQASSTKVSCVIYNSNARVAFEDEKPTLSLINKVKFQGGGTNYSDAMESTKKICDKHAGGSDKLVFYFMSDGHASCPHS